MDRKSRNVLWSTYEKPREGHAPEQLKHTADVIAKEFKTARTGKITDRPRQPRPLFLSATRL